MSDFNYDLNKCVYDLYRISYFVYINIMYKIYYSLNSFLIFETFHLYFTYIIILFLK